MVKAARSSWKSHPKSAGEIWGKKRETREWRGRILRPLVNLEIGQKELIITKRRPPVRGARAHTVQNFDIFT